ncbi:MAG: 5'-nucleotidase C-terminal domain-containing protein [Vicinamibacterales bacterium]
MSQGRGFAKPFRIGLSAIALIAVGTAAVLGGGVLYGGDPPTGLVRGSEQRSSASQRPRADDQVTISVVGTNDLHGGVLPRGGGGGLALLGGYLDNLRAARSADGGAVVLVDAGDMFQGTLESSISEGATVIAAYNLLGYSAAAIGNHDFDFGPVGAAATPQTPADDPVGALKARALGARFPLLAANIIDLATNNPIAWPHVQPSVVLDSAGVKVAIIGVTTRSTLRQTIGSNTRQLRIAPLASTVASEAARLRRAGAAVVVVAAHAGGACTRFDNPIDLSSCDASSEIGEVARALPNGLVDVIVAGHTHAAMAHVIHGIPIVESFSGGMAFGRVDLTVSVRAQRVSGHHIFAPQRTCGRVDAATQQCVGSQPEDAGGTSASSYEGRQVVPHRAVSDLLTSVEREVRARKAQPLGVTLDGPIRRFGLVESALGNLFTDGMLAAVPGADVAINNTAGGLRADLAAGPLTYGRVFEMFPFDNALVEVRLTGAELRRVLMTHFATARQRNALGVSGMHAAAGCRNGRLVVEMARPSGAAITDTERLRVITTDFLALNGDGIFAPVAPAAGLVVENTGRLAREAVVDWLRDRGGRIREEQWVDTNHPRLQYPNGPLVRCGSR